MKAEKELNDRDRSENWLGVANQITQNLKITLQGEQSKNDTNFKFIKGKVSKITNL